MPGPRWGRETDIGAIVLAGGLGTRLRSVVRDLPKAMASVGGRPFLAYVLEHLRSQYLRQVGVAVGYRGEAIREYFRAGEAFGLQIAYSDEGNRKLGTGGALARALQTYGGRRPGGGGVPDGGKIGGA